MFTVSACGESNSNREMAEGIFPDMSHSKNNHICLSKGKETTIVKKVINVHSFGKHVGENIYFIVTL